MKKIYFLLPLAVALAACQDDYFKNNFEDEAEYTISEVAEKEYTLTSTDYSTIATNSVNKAIADSLDEVFGVTTYSEALAAVKKNGYFNEFALAEDYLPVFVQNKWPNADNGSKFTITYNSYKNDLSYIDQLDKMSAYTFTESDYVEVWNGRGAYALTLSPMTQLKLSGMVKSAFPDAVEGDMAMISYAYENSEPSTGSKVSLSYANPYLFVYSDEGGYKLANDVENGEICLLAAYTDGAYIPFGYLATDTLAGNFVGNPLVAADDVIGEDDAEIWYLNIIRANDSAFYIQNCEGMYVSSAVSGGPFFLSADIPAEGAEWLFETCADGSVKVVNSLTGKCIKYVKKNGSYALYEESTVPSVTVEPTHSRLYQYNGSSWLTLSLSDATVVVFQPSDYTIFGDGVTYVSNPDVMLPVWLNSQYPYAEDETVVAMSYKVSSSKCAASVYRKSTDGWVKATPYAEESVLLSKEKGQITAKLSVYINKSLLGDDGGFTTQNIALDGLNYVWTNTSSYGWKASGYYSSLTPAYRNAESWLVSPALNFKNAANPYLSFDQVYKYLATGDAAEYNERLGVFVSTDYTGDVTTCTWTQVLLTDDALPTNQDWTFVNSGNLDLTPFIGGKCWVAFRYTSSYSDDYTAAATWEVKNVLVREPEE